MKIEKVNPVEIELDKLSLKGVLSIPKISRGTVVFSHGSGSSHLSPRNIYVAQKLNSFGFSSLLFDLLTEEEDRVFENRFNIELLTERLLQTCEWLMEKNTFNSNPLAFFGASTGAASAIRAAALLGSAVKAIVSRGGRPDLAGINFLRQLSSPILLLVGEKDPEVLRLNEDAMTYINGIKKIEIIPEADHLFTVPGTLEKVAILSVKWLNKFLIH